MRGIDLVLLNRGQTARPIPEGVRVVQGDIRDKASAERALGDETFDVVLFLGVFYHLTHVMTAFTQLRHRVKEGGVLLVEGGVIDDPDGVLGIDGNCCLHGLSFRGRLG